jgi:hypothetical protein
MSINRERNLIDLIIDYFSFFRYKKGDQIVIGRPKFKSNATVYTIYIIPPPIPPPYPPPGGTGGPAGSSFGFSATMASVVNISAATEAAF